VPDHARRMAGDGFRVGGSGSRREVGQMSASGLLGAARQARHLQCMRQCCFARGLGQ
jgi:hypothetical protein